MKVYLPIHTFVVIVVYFWKLKFLHEGIYFFYLYIHTSVVSVVYFGSVVVVTNMADLYRSLQV